MDIDKDINRCKELIKTEHSNWIGMSNQDAISNVLSDRETWKKIAEKLSEELDRVTEEVAREKGIDDFAFCNSNCHNKDYLDIECKQCLLDWAKREVNK